ncbi:response regulator [candidate division KSB1 bacterium]
MKRHKLLFVDDEENVLKSLKRLFHEEKYEIYTANNGLEGIKLLERLEFSLILSDYRMPELNGVDFLRLVKEKSPYCIRMILTGIPDVSVAISAINEGEVYKFINKPWDDENLKVQIKRAIEHYELVREREELLERIKMQNEELRKWNINLEKRVEEKTMELKKAYEKLQLKVKELEGRDKILQSLLTINTLEETLDLILEMILDIVKFDNIVLYYVF